MDTRWAILAAAAALTFAVGCEKKDGHDSRQNERAVTPESVQKSTEEIGRIQPLETDAGGKVTKAGLVMDDEKIIVLASEDPNMDWNQLVGAQLRVPGKLEAKDDGQPGTLTLKLKNLDILEVAANVELEKVPVKNVVQVDTAQEPMIRGADGRLRTQEELDKEQEAREEQQKKAEEARKDQQEATKDAREKQEEARQDPQEAATEEQPARTSQVPPVAPAAPAAPAAPDTQTEVIQQRTEVIEQPAPVAPSNPANPSDPAAVPPGPVANPPGKI